MATRRRPSIQPSPLLEAVCKSRGCLKKGGEPEYEKGAALVLDDFRSGRLGRMTLELPKKGGVSHEWKKQS